MKPEASDAGIDSSSLPKPRWFRVALFASIVGLLAVIFWAALPSSNRLRAFRGKPEGEWIKNLKYWDDAQVAEWRGYGNEGVQVLIRGLHDANRPWERTYRNVIVRIPGPIARYLPAARDDSTRATRMCIVSLISSLAKDARSATPAMIWTVKNDEAEEVRQSALNYFNSSEDENSMLNHLPLKQKHALLPALLEAVQNPRNWGLRNNAAISLRWFPEKREIVAPVLVKALHDPQPQVQLLAAEALNHVAPDVAAKAHTTAVLVSVASHPDDQIAARAVAALGRPGSDPALAVPALLRCLKSTNTLIGCEAVWALDRAGNEFNSYSNRIIPGLSEAAQRKDNVGGYAKSTLRRYTSKLTRPDPTP